LARQQLRRRVAGQARKRAGLAATYKATSGPKSQSLTQSAPNPILITHLADFSVQEVNFEHIF
jgi:hypothetical protein